MAEKYEVSIRTIKRDLELIREQLLIDIKCTGGAHPKYSTSPEEFLSLDKRLSKQGLLLFALIESFSRNHFLFPLDFKLIRDNMKLPISDSFLELTGHISYEMSEEKPISLDLFYSLMESIQDKMQLNIKYYNLKDSVSCRKVETYHLRNSDGQWYLIGWCHFRNCVRIFHVSRIISWRRVNVPFSQSLSFEQISNILDSSFGIMIDTDGDAVPVSILFKGRAVKLVEGKRWHDKQIIEIVPGGMKVTFPVDSFE